MRARSRRYHPVEFPLGAEVEERRLALDCDHFVNDHVRTLLTRWFALEKHGHPELPSNLVTPRAQLALERSHVDVLQKAETQRVVILVECSDSRPRDRFMEEVASRHSAI